jgi:ubiquitin-like modifier-activating enzyme 5
MVCSYLGYNAMKDFFPTMEIKPNVSCSNPKCVALQKQVTERKNSPEAIAARKAKEAAAAAAVAAPVHDSNEWGIEVVSMPHVLVFYMMQMSACCSALQRPA